MQSKSALETLRQNATEFFDRVSTKNGEKMSCQAGCAACCHAEFSVSLAEAALISNWFSSLGLDQQAKLKTEWSKPKLMGVDPLGKAAAPCAFLLDSKCSVYFARPLICRTQGLPLKIQNEENEIVVDACPLNFDAGKNLPKQEDWLDLDRMNELKIIAERFSPELLSSEKIILEIKPQCDSNGRIALRQLVALL